MKLSTVITLLFIITILACESPPTNYARLSGKISNRNCDSLIITNHPKHHGYPFQYKKVIAVTPFGSFEDTLKIHAGFYQLYDPTGKLYTSIYLRNGFDLQTILDGKQKNAPIYFEGEGSESNNLLIQEALFPRQLN